MTEAPRIDVDGRHRKAATTYWGTLPGMSDDPEGELAEAFATFEAAQIASLEAVTRELAAEREKFTMHTAEVGAWLSLIADQFGINTGDVRSTCSLIADGVSRALIAEQRLAIAEEAFERIGGLVDLNLTANPTSAMTAMREIARTTLAKLKDTTENG